MTYGSTLYQDLSTNDDGFFNTPADLAPGTQTLNGGSNFIVIQQTSESTNAYISGGTTYYFGSTQWNPTDGVYPSYPVWQFDTMNSCNTQTFTANPAA